MNDPEIRKILISYLEAQSDDLRIYNEKAIGNAVCDILAVGKELVGYEIKSDQDNYRRLEKQVRVYDLYFDRNYIVVGASHAASVSKKVPEHWGIICIERDKVEVIRSAGKNASCSRGDQLSMLWKIELKNILIKNGMPLYAQKSKWYINVRIRETVDSALLGEQIAYELLHRDYSIFEDPKDAPDKENAHLWDRLPADEIVDTLSENDLQEITLDRWIALYHKARIRRELKETAAARITAKRIPHAITHADIEAALGSPFIPARIIEDFISDLFYDNAQRCRCDYEPITGNWYIRRSNTAQTG